MKADLSIVREQQPYFFYTGHVLAKWSDGNGSAGLVMEERPNYKGRTIYVNKFGYGELGRFVTLEDAEKALLTWGGISYLDTLFYEPDCPLSKSIMTRLE